MKIWVIITVLLSVVAAMSFQRATQTCHPFSATSVAIMNQNIDNPSGVFVDDPQLTYFRDIMKFRDDTIQHTLEDAFKFFNETYGLDFSLSPPTDQNEYFYQNARLSPSRLADDIDYLVTLNNWIQTGNTRSTCYKIRDGGFQVSFSDDQLLHGSYGGAGGLPVGVTNFIAYGFYNIDVCQQSPVIIQVQSATPVRVVPVDGTLSTSVDLYNTVLGRGKGRISASFTPDQERPGEFRLEFVNVLTFPAN